MAAYYTPPRPQVAAPRRSSSHRTDQQRDREELTTIDLDFGDHSIYVFPNPSSVPPSPASSLFSPSSSFSPSSFSSSSSRSRSRSRAQHDNSRFFSRARSNPTASISSAGAEVSSNHIVPPSPISPNLIEDDPDVDEVWDWTRDYSDGQSSESWILEEEVERVSRWDIALRSSQFAPRAIPSSSQRAARLMDHGPPRPRLTPLRTRALSRSTNASLGSLRSSSVSLHDVVRPASPQPRIRLPLLTFFASLFSLDLDDPALRLLTQSSSTDEDSVLFPGHIATSLSLPASGCMVQFPSHSFQSESDLSDMNEDSDIDVATKYMNIPDPCADVHGLERLLSTTTDPSGAALRSLRAGLALPRGIPIEFGVSSIAGFWRAMGEVYTRSGQAWREVWEGS
ncbi:uncharacterized protein FIBRA_05628 [Fibroporia radiculosa]|uniref:Uncharacterized protein n=1 Tax=Fibroporia radiculosa TaxID=599839 RepID=J4H3M3_9APHY|nr:uncharacterized protein FIBRA_05628 [Fibroporia radiculosa]CCM03494.1 predicted protein [Fibroporia radiculosa]